MGRGRPIDSSSWPAQGPKRRFAELLDKVHRDNGVKSLRTVAAAMNLRSPSRVSALLRLKALPADESQVRMLIKALGGSDEDIERGLRLYRAIMSAPQDTGRSSGAQIHGATITVDPAIAPAVAAGASSPASVRRTLPRDIPEFTGRDEELQALLNASRGRDEDRQAGADLRHRRDGRGRQDHAGHARCPPARLAFPGWAVVRAAARPRPGAAASRTRGRAGRAAALDWHGSPADPGRAWRNEHSCGATGSPVSASCWCWMTPPPASRSNL